MRVLVLGGDGYLGWPTAMYLSTKGHEVTIVDNYLRRNIMREEDVQPLQKVLNLDERLRVWQEISGFVINKFIGNLSSWNLISNVFKVVQPDVIIHYAEQPSAPYSMLSREASILTIGNNLGVTTNVIFAVKEFCPDAHIIKLGTMGEYGTPNIDIEEGWLEITHKKRKDKFLYPRQGGSLYHTTKIMDTDLLWYYVRMWGIRVTDLMQGPVYGIFTEESELDDKLLTFFSYDELFGTVLNRFVVQAVAGYPLTVYGRGGQTRGYINIRDSLSCVDLALNNPADNGELKIYNQFTEVFSVNELALKVQNAGKEIGLDVIINNINNPRIEMEDHYYNPKHTELLELGLQPNYLNNEILIKMMNYVQKHKKHISEDKIFRGTKWS